MRHKLIAIATLLLAACGSQDKAGNGGANAAAGESAAAEAEASAIALTPGEWETTVEVASLNIVGGPQLPGGMTPPLPPPTTIRSCLTPEQAARPNANFLTGSGERGRLQLREFLDGRRTHSRHGHLLQPGHDHAHDDERPVQRGRL